jgi:hypothetical protein
VKRIEQRDVLDTDKNVESEDIEAIKRDNAAIRMDINETLDKMEALKKFAQTKNIQIPFELM